MAWLVHRSAPFLAYTSTFPLVPHWDLIWELGIGPWPLGRPVHGIIGGARKLSHLIMPTNGVDFLITAAVLYINSLTAYLSTYNSLARILALIQTPRRSRVGKHGRIVADSPEGTSTEEENGANWCQNCPRDLHACHGCCPCPILLQTFRGVCIKLRSQQQ